MGSLIEGAVSLSDVAKQVKRPAAEVQREAAELGLFVGEDWAGRPALSAADAAALTSGKARQDLDHDRAWREHTAASEAWEAQREAARRAAFQEAYDAPRRSGLSNAAGSEKGYEAARAAMERFERSTPAPQFQGRPSVRSWIGDAVDRVRGVVQ